MTEIRIAIETQRKKATDRLNKTSPDNSQPLISAKGPSPRPSGTTFSSEFEYEQILRKGELREKKQREKLDEALRKIRRLQNTSQEDFRCLDEFERLKRE
jgi:hypothetical protein